MIPADWPRLLSPNRKFLRASVTSPSKSVFHLEKATRSTTCTRGPLSLNLTQNKININASPCMIITKETFSPSLSLSLLFILWLYIISTWGIFLFSIHIVAPITSTLVRAYSILKEGTDRPVCNVWVKQSWSKGDPQVISGHTKTCKKTHKNIYFKKKQVMKRIPCENKWEVLDGSYLVPILQNVC